LVLARVARAARAVTAAPPAAAPPRRSSLRGGRALGTHRDRDQPIEPSRAAPAARLDRAAFVLLYPVIPLGEEILERSLDLGFGRPGLLRPDPRPIWADGLRWRVGIGRFGFDHGVRLEVGRRVFRLEIGHHLVL
jgi:hypothetical protein